MFIYPSKIQKYINCLILLLTNDLFIIGCEQINGITYQVKEIIIYEQGSNYTNDKNDKNDKTKNKYQQSKLDVSLFKID